ncbi:MAG: 30S ribosomal protein S4 [Patescibacteria group bacterium]|jgi:small subunit ribosomal protein S4
MAKNLNSKCKQCRRIGEKLFLKGERCFTPKCAMIKRNYPPGMHGVKGSSRLSEYGMQLREKQRAAKTYHILEKQFSNYYKKAKQLKGETSDNFLRLLELRLDNVIYRLGLTKSRSIASQLISHGHIFVNGKKLDISSYQTRVGDIITLKPLSKKKVFFEELVKKINKKDLPKWLIYVDDKELQAKVISQPAKEDLPGDINAPIIIEYYSR